MLWLPGEVDALLTTIDESTLYWRPEAPFAVILAIDDSSQAATAFWFRNDRNIGSIEDLKGKRWGCG